MIERTQFGDVTAFRLSWPRSQAIGLSVYVYAVNGILVDSGFPGVAGKMSALLAELRPRGAFLTHWHEDHAGNIELLAKMGIPIGADANALEMLRSPKRIGFYRRFTWTSMPPLVSRVTPFHDDVIAMVATPGHSDDHHAIWDASTGTLFAGDLFLGVKVRVAHSYENPRQLVQSLRAMATREPARVFCAHRGLVANGANALRAKADWLSEIIARVDRLIDEERSDADIRREVLGPLGWAHWFSAGDYSPMNLVRCIRITRFPNGSPTAPHAPR